MRLMENPAPTVRLVPSRGWMGLVGGKTGEQKETPRTPTVLPPQWLPPGDPEEVEGRKGGEVVRNERLVTDKRPGHPGAVLRTIAFPVDKILPTATPPTGVHNPSDRIEWVPQSIPGG
ncbi:hypothetical protein XENOCAPTIV_017312 [Xenoophorus captivus]|uniref:Uncharacterized protein n=1 Tax=Xenoophorus captivus TaxID=1517983 RepID=A0ABV0RSU6_9TELE